MEHRVIAHSGCSYANIPVEFFIGDEHHVVGHVVETWLEESLGMEGMTRQVWRVEDEEGRRFRLTYHWVSDFWKIQKENGE